MLDPGHFLSKTPFLLAIHQPKMRVFVDGFSHLKHSVICCNVRPSRFLSWFINHSTYRFLSTILGGPSHLVSGLVHPSCKWTLPPLIPLRKPGWTNPQPRFVGRSPPSKQWLSIVLGIVDWLGYLGGCPGSMMMLIGAAACSQMTRYFWDDHDISWYSAGLKQAMVISSHDIQPWYISHLYLIPMDIPIYYFSWFSVRQP